MTGLIRFAHRAPLAGALLVLVAGSLNSVAVAQEDSGTGTHGDPIIIPPGGNPGLPPSNAPFAPPIPLDFDQPGGSLNYDQAEAPDFGPLCEGGVGFFPTKPQSPSATGGRSGPRHAEVSEQINVLLGRNITYELGFFTPQCDWLSPGCDSGDDGLMLLCLDAQCSAGMFISRGTCGLGFGASFGAAPTLSKPDAFFVARTRTGADYLGLNFFNIGADIDGDGTIPGIDATWPLRDSVVANLDNHDQIHRTGVFPLQTFDAESADDWSVGSFWARFMVSEEPLVPVTVGWDGSGRSFPYQWGETEDWLVRTQEGRWHCRLPESAVRTSLHAVISLDPEDTECLDGVEFTITSNGQLAGKIRQFRESTLQPAQPMPVEVSTMTVRGNIPELGGTVNFRERSDRLSLGVVDVFQTAAGAFAEGDAFLDISFAIDFLDIPRTLDTGSVFVRVEAPNISAFPPVGVPFLARPDAAPIALIDRATLQLAGWLCVLDIQFTQVTSGGCSGDATNDGVVDFNDIASVLANWGQAGASGDASGDCFVDFIDVTAVLASWNTSCQ